MIIGVDLDNTIANHYETFKQFSNEHEIVLDDDENPKQILKTTCFKKSHGNLLWTKIQGEVYGKRMLSAVVFDGFIGFLKKAKSLNHEVILVSHRSIFPSQGDAVNLHNTALKWLNEKSLINKKLLPFHKCFFETSLEKKIDRIKTEYCDVFIDDLPSVLNHQNFPKQTIGILFGSRNSTMPNLISWNDSNWIFDLPEQQIQIKPIFYKSLPVDKHEKCFRKLLQFKTQSTIKIEAVAGGANNRAYKILTDEKIFMGKVFFRDKDDSRDRLFHEICFESYLGSLELNCYPKILKTDKNSGIAIYQWLNGKKFDAILEIKKKYWELCLQFIDKLQTNKNSEVAKKIPNSSESAFSLKEHLSILQSRHDYWLNFCNNSNNNIPSSIKEFILGDLELYYQKLAKETLVHPNFDHLLCSEGRIVSPSDFGLHNTLIKDDDSLYFFDFEYAGWDDPAKTIADFFCQPRYPPPLELYPLFVETFLNFLPQKAHKPFIERLNIIYRIVSLKWCYIRLNGIHEIHNQRRKFANYSETDENSIIKYFKTILQNPAMNYLP